ncbi:hypothetical protein BJ170DRAFT_81950 [Xylariales sp. AK1849]|nr:hypothetical protein BJ170DRAFT_81950 [Xylariales sp. AK1849]
MTAGSESSLAHSSDLDARPRLDSDGESSVTADETFHRLGRAPVLPSASSYASIKHLTKKLAAIPRARRHESPIPAGRHLGPSKYSKANEPQPPPALQPEAHSPEPLSYGSHGLVRIPHGHQGTSQMKGSGHANQNAEFLAPKQSSELASSRALWHGDMARSSLQSDSGEDEEDSTDEEATGRVPDLNRNDMRLITEQWTRVREQRDILKDTFHDIGKERTTLQDIRQRKDQAYRNLRLAIQEILPNNPGLNQLFNGAQDLDLVYQEAETNFDGLIDELQKGELHLELEERRFYTAFAESDTSTESDDSRPTSRITLRGIRGDRSEDLHPTYESFQDAFRELQLAKEGQMDLALKRRRVASKKVEDLAGEEEDFLKSYDALYGRAQEEFQHWMEIAENLETKCRERNLIPQDVLTQQEGFRFFNVSSDDIYLEEVVLTNSTGVGPKTLADPHYSHLLSNPMHLLKDPFPQTAEKSLRMACSLPPTVPKRETYIQNAKKEFGIESLLGSSGDEDKRGYINRWLLHQVRQSAMEAELLRAQFGSVLQILDLQQWQRDVLYFWSRDAAATQPAIPPTDVKHHLSSGTAQVSLRTPHRTSVYPIKRSLSSQIVLLPSTRMSSDSSRSSSRSSRLPTDIKRASIHPSTSSISSSDTDSSASGD